MSEVEVTEIDLEWAVIDHLSNPDSALELYRERITTDHLLEGEWRARKVMTWVYEFIESYDQAPALEALEVEFPEFEFEESPHPVAFVIERIRHRFARNEIEEVFEVVANALREEDPVRAARVGLNRLQTVVSNTQTQKHSIEVSENWKTAYDRYRADVVAGRLQGVTTGWENIDIMTGGIRGLVFYLGRLKRYKSWFLLNSAIQAARSGLNVALYSLEMPKEEMEGRFECMATDTSWSRFQRGVLEEKDYANWRTGMEQWAQLVNDGEYGRLHILHPPLAERTVSDLHEKAKSLDAQVIYIDQFKFIQPTRFNEKRHQEAEWICEDLKDLANQIPVACAAQFNRQAASFAEIGEAAHIAISDSLGQTADLMFGTFQDKELRGMGQVEFGTVESRSSEGGVWYMGIAFNEGCKINYIEPKEDV